MRDVKELLFFMLSFIPWLLFLVIPIDSLSGLKLVIGICFSASVVFRVQRAKKWNDFILGYGPVFYRLYPSGKCSQHHLGCREHGRTFQRGFGWNRLDFHLSWSSVCPAICPPGSAAGTIDFVQNWLKVVFIFPCFGV